jgi:hypothetical protein
MGARTVDQAVAHAEATIDRGVHVGILADYVDNYDGDVVLARRDIPESEILAEVNARLALVDG